AGCRECRIGGGDGQKGRHCRQIRQSLRRPCEAGEGRETRRTSQSSRRIVQRSRKSSLSSKLMGLRNRRISVPRAARGEWSKAWAPLSVIWLCSRESSCRESSEEEARAWAPLSPIRL